MKKLKQHFLVLAIILILPLVLLTGCITDSTITHQLSEKWGYNNEYHWHTCDCGKNDCKRTYSEALHIWSNPTTTETPTKTITSKHCICGATQETFTQTEEQMYQVLKNVYESFYDYDITMDYGYMIGSWNAQTKEAVSYDTNDTNLEYFTLSLKTNNGYELYEQEAGDKIYYVVSEDEYLAEMVARPTLQNTFEEYKDFIGCTSASITKVGDVYTLVISSENSSTETTTFTDEMFLTDTIQHHSGETKNTTFSKGFNQEKFDEIKAYVEEHKDEFELMDFD